MIIVFAALDDCFGRMSIASVQDKGIVLFEKRTIAFQFHFLIIKYMSCNAKTQCNLKQIKKFLQIQVLPIPDFVFYLNII